MESIVHEFLEILANFKTTTLFAAFFDELNWMGGWSTADHLCTKCDQYAAAWAPIADQIWEKLAKH